MAHFYFVRHGETEWNKADRICGISESPLTERGRQQAAEAGEYIKAQGLRIDEILFSPLGRAKETASIISGITGIPMREEKRIREHNFGKFEGTSPKDAPDFILAKQNFANDFEGGESLFRVAQRVYNVLDEVIAPNDNGGVGVIRFQSPITTVDPDALFCKRNLISVTLPNSVETIGACAFASCVNLTQVSFGTNLKTIGVRSFEYCALTDLELPDGLLSIKVMMFR